MWCWNIGEEGVVFFNLRPALFEGDDVLDGFFLVRELLLEERDFFFGCSVLDSLVVDGAER